MPPKVLSLEDTANKIIADGPHKQEPANRRIRGQLGGKWMFDGLNAEYVWEHPYYPMFYIPLKGIEAGGGELVRDTHTHNGWWLGTLFSGEKNCRVAVFMTGPLRGYVRIENGGLDAWYSENQKLLGTHPKDPYKRVETLPSTREIRIEVDGTVIAKSSSNVFLYETMLRPRYYLPPTSILDNTMLIESKTSSVCPYKGVTSYYHLKVGDKVIEDAIWYYPYPTAESAMIQGRLCFYNEKVDVFVDGEKEKAQ